jgi:hypothetical protein
MAEGMFVPQNVRFMSQKLSGYSRNRFKVMPLGSRSASAGTITNWALPENALIDTSSIRVHANVTTTGGSAGSGPTIVYGKLPQSSCSLVQRLNVSINGVSIMNSGVSEYNSLCAALKNAGGANKDRDSSYDRAVCHGAIDGSSDSNEDVSIIIDFPAGCLSQNSTRFWPTQALGSVTIECQWADNSVLVAKEHNQDVGAGNLSANGKTAAASIAYTISGLYLTLDTISLPEYDAMLRQRLSQEASLSIAIKSYYTFTKDGIAADADTMVFSVSSSSIDRIIGTHRNSSYRSIGMRGWALTDQLGDANVGNYFRFLSLDSSTTKAGTKGTMFRLNNGPFPTYEANVIESLADNCYSVDKVGANSLGMICSSLPAFHQGLYSAPLLLAHPTGMVMPSGFDSRGVASQGQWECTGMVMPTPSASTGELGTVSSFLIVECTEQIIFSLGREVIHVH